MRPIRPAVSVAVACALSGAFVLSAQLVGDGTARLISDVTSIALPFLAAVVCARAAWRHTGRPRLAWTLIAAALASWGTGELLWMLLEVVWHKTPFPSVADIGYLAGFPLAAAGVVLFPVVRKRGRHSPLRSLLDALLVSVSVFLVGWVTVLHPLVDASSGRVIEQVISLAYPISDVALVAVVLFVSGDPLRDREMPLALLGFGFLGMAVADFAFAYLTLTDAYRSGDAIDAGWIWAYVVLGMAALSPTARQRWTRIHARVTELRSALPYIVAGLAFVLVLIAGKGGIGAAGGPLIYWSPVVLAILAVTRHFVVALDRKTDQIEHLHVLDELKDSFMQAASHELRTPLTVIKGVAETLEEAEDLPDDVRRTLYASLRRNSDRLDGLLQSLLDLGRLERGVIVPQRQETDVAGLIRRIVEDVSAPSHEVVAAIEGHVVSDVDPSQLERIVENFVINAVRHTPPGSTVEVSAERRADGLLVTVDDDGPGVPSDRREDVFQAFVRVQNPGHETPGTGIGLAIVDQFAKLHGGRAWVEESPRGGARFRVFLADPPEHADDVGALMAGITATKKARVA